MEPTGFDGANANYAAEGCGDLPAMTDGTQVLTCWQMTWRERFVAFAKGKVWLCLQGQRVPPMWMHVGKQGEPE